MTKLYKRKRLSFRDTERQSHLDCGLGWAILDQDERTGLQGWVWGFGDETGCEETRDKAKQCIRRALARYLKQILEDVKP